MTSKGLTAAQVEEFKKLMITRLSDLEDIERIHPIHNAQEKGRRLELKYLIGKLAEMEGKE